MYDGVVAKTDKTTLLGQLHAAKSLPLTLAALRGHREGFTVVSEITFNMDDDPEITTPEAAAMKFWEMLRRPESIANVFTVIPTTNGRQRLHDATLVDLEGKV